MFKQAFWTWKECTNSWSSNFEKRNDFTEHVKLNKKSTWSYASSRKNISEYETRMSKLLLFRLFLLNFFFNFFAQKQNLKKWKYSHNKYNWIQLDKFSTILLERSYMQMSHCWGWVWNERFWVKVDGPKIRKWTVMFETGRSKRA